MPRFWFSKDSPSGRLTAISFALVLVGHVLVGSPHRAIPFESAAAAVRQAIQERAYARADELAYRLSRSIAASHGGASALAAQADALVVEVRIARGGAADADTLARAQRAVSTLAQQLGPDRPETIEAAFTLGRVQSARRDFTSALASHERVLAWRLRRLGRDAEAVADSLDESAVALLHLGRFDESEARLRDAIRIRESHAAESPLALARTSGLLGLHRRMNGQYAEAAEPLSRAMAIYRRVAPEDPEVISILQTNGDLALILGDPEAAQRTWADALDRVVRTFGEQHHAAADLLRRLGLAAFSLGSLAEGRELRQRALAIAEWTLAPCDFTRVDFMNDVAISLQYDGEYTEARALHQRALAALQRCDSAPAADSLATVLFNDASVAAQMGETADAETQYERAITIWKTNFGEAHPFVATGLDALASLIAPRQRPRARELFEEALAVRRRALGASHPLVAWTLANSAWVISELGEHHEALSRINRAVEILSRTPPADEPDHLSRVLEIRAAVEARHGNRRAARESLAGALGARERVFGAQHPLTAESRSRLAISDYMLGRAGPALDLALSAERAGLEHLRFTMRYLSERQALAYAARRPSGLDLALSIAVSSPTTVGPGRIADALVRSRRVILDELAARTRGAASVDESGDPEAQAVTAAGDSRTCWCAASMNPFLARCSSRPGFRRRKPNARWPSGTPMHAPSSIGCRSDSTRSERRCLRDRCWYRSSSSDESDRGRA
jgi:tetratricopeptide (TPR) repeat protein